MRGLGFDFFVWGLEKEIRTGIIRFRCAVADLVRCGVRFTCGQGFIRTHTSEWEFFCGLSPKYKDQNQNFSHIFEIDRTTHQDNEMNEDLFE